MPICGMPPKRKGLWVVNFGEMTESDDEDLPHPPRGAPGRDQFPGLKDITGPEYPASTSASPIRPGTSVRRFPSRAGSPGPVSRSRPPLAPPGPHPGRPGEPADPTLHGRRQRPGLGQIVERLSRSPSWSSLPVLVLEDDAAERARSCRRRTVPCCCSHRHTPARQLDSTCTRRARCLRSIELILGLAPLSQYDAAATPL